MLGSNMYEADYDIYLEIFGLHKATHYTERYHTLGKKQLGIIPLYNAENVALLDELETEVH